MRSSTFVNIRSGHVRRPATRPNPFLRQRVALVPFAMSPPPYRVMASTLLLQDGGCLYARRWLNLSDSVFINSSSVRVRNHGLFVLV